MKPGCLLCGRSTAAAQLLRISLVLVLVAIVTGGARPAQAQATGSVTVCAGAASAPYLSLGSPFAAALSSRIDHTVLYASTNRFGLLHTGLDLPAKLSTPILAAGAGRVLLAGPDAALLYSPRANYYGKMIVLQLDAPAENGPVHVIYGHLDRVSVSTGQQVNRGDRIGFAGMTGVAVGPHLHLEVRYPSPRFADARNPALWLAPAPGTGVIAGRLLDAAGKPAAGERLLVYRLTPKQTLWRVITTYRPGAGVNQDAAWQENFSLPDAPAGKYRIIAGRGATARQVDVVTPAGGLAFVQLQLGSAAAASATLASAAAPSGTERDAAAPQTCYWSPATGQVDPDPVSVAGWPAAGYGEWR